VSGSSDELQLSSSSDEQKVSPTYLVSTIGGSMCIGMPTRLSIMLLHMFYKETIILLF